MEITATAKAWTNALEFMSNVVSKSDKDIMAFRALHLIPAAGGHTLRFRGASRAGFLDLTTTDEKFRYSKELQPFPVDVGSLLPFVKNIAKDAEVTLTVSDNEIALSSGTGRKKSRLEMRRLSAFEPLNEPASEFTGTVEIPGKTVGKIVALMDLSDLAFRFRGLFLVDNCICGGASDILGVLHTATQYPETAIDPDIQFALDRAETIQLSFAPSRTKIAGPDFEYRAVNLTIAPPKVHKLAELQTSAELVVQKDDLAGILKLAQAVAGDSDFCLFSHNNGSLRVRNAVVEGATEYECEATSSAPSDFMVKASVLAKALKNLEADSVTIGETEQYLLIREGNFTHVLKKASKEKAATYAK